MIVLLDIKKESEALELQDWLIAARAYPSFCDMKRLRGLFLLPLDLLLISPSQVTPPQFVRFPQQFASTHLYFCVERGTVSLARARIQTARSGDKHTNHEVTAPRIA